LAEGSVAGGRTYDALIAACALETGATVLLTLNEAHFRQFEVPGLKVVVPSAG
jgi:predicted nucleic acid-binding protein